MNEDKIEEGMPGGVVAPNSDQFTSASGMQM